MNTDRGLNTAGIAAVVVAYFPAPGFTARLAAIAREFTAVVIVDNSDVAGDHASWLAALTAIPAEIISGRGNVGLGAALNQGFARLQALGFTWVVAFDQDSTPAAGFVAEHLLSVSSNNQPTARSVAAIGANWVDENRPDHPSLQLKPHEFSRSWFQRVPARHDLDDITCVITSGTLFHLPTWQKLGGFNEPLFLDLVDTEYCLRARQAGYQILVVAGAHLLHQRGSKRAVRFLGRTWWPAFAPALRLRYLFRNRVILMRQYGAAEPHWVTFELVYSAKIIAEILFLENDKLRKLAACLRGTWDGWRGLTGKIG